MTVAHAEPSRGGASWLALFVLGSLGLHAVALLWLGHRPPPQTPPPPKAMELVMVEVQPAPPKPQPLEPKPEPKLLPPPRVRVAHAEKPPPPHDEPPPPNEPPKEEEKPAPIVVGLTLSSTTQAGSFAAAVGNTMYGKSDPTAKAPGSVQPYSAPKYVPSYQVDTPPQPAEEIHADYPPEVRREEIEGVVLLSVMVLPSGEVGEVKVLKSLDRRLDELAVRTLKRSHWKPAVVKGERVSTEIKYNFRFELSR
jgi:protein TonB